MSKITNAKRLAEWLKWYSTYLASSRPSSNPSTNTKEKKKKDKASEYINYLQLNLDLGTSTEKPGHTISQVCGSFPFDTLTHFSGH
jgi:hypothetical protein